MKNIVPRRLLRHFMGIACVLLAVWGGGLIYEGLAEPYLVWWAQAAIGTLCLVCALEIYRRWFSSAGVRGGRRL